LSRKRGVTIKKVNKKSTKNLLITALFAATITALTLFPKIPAPPGYIHLGDSMIFLAACILPFPCALAAAAVGGALADYISGYPLYIIPTIIVKSLITLPYSSKSERILTIRNALMVFPAGLITLAGYFAATLILFDINGAWTALLGDISQVAGSSVLFLIIAAALDKIKFKQKFVKR